MGDVEPRRARDPIAVEALIRATRDDDDAVRVAAGSALDKLGSVAVMLGVAALMRPMLADAGWSNRPPSRSRLGTGEDCVLSWPSGSWTD